MATPMPEDAGTAAAARSADALLAAVADPLHPDLTCTYRGPGEVVLHLPFFDALVGNPWTGDIHGGVLTTLLDKATRAAVLSLLDAGEAALPLNLRVDHMGATRSRQGLRARARCHRLARAVAFAEGDVTEARTGRIIATGVSSLLRVAEDSAP